MSKISRREFLRVSATAAGAALLAACGATPTATQQQPVATAAPVGEATKAPVAEATKAPVVEATKAPEATAVPAVVRPKDWPMATPPRNRTLKYYWQAAPAAGVVNAFNTAYNHQTGSALLYEPCAFYSAHSDKTYMWLAESYKYNDTATECTITFRKGIKWSDGTAFTAADPAWSMETLKRVDGLSRNGTYKNELTSATVVDDNTLKVTLNQTDWRFFTKSLTFRFDLGDDSAIQPQHVFKDVADADLAKFVFFDKAKQWPISTAAYGLSESTDQVSYYDLRPSWWAVDTKFVDKEPDVWRVEQTLFTNDTTAAQMLINKDIDQSLDLRPLVCASALNQSDNLTTWTGKKPPYGYMDWWPISVWCRCSSAPTDKKEVRWALAYAIDQQKVVDVAWAGAGLVSNKPFPGFVKLNKFMDGIKDITDQFNVLEFNLDKSAALMTQAGYTKNKDGFWSDSTGTVTNFDLVAPVPLFGDIGPIVAEQLRSAGFSCQHLAPPDMWTAVGDGRTPLHFFGHGGSTIDPYDTFLLYASPVMPEGQDCGNNRARWKNQNFIDATTAMNNTAMDDEAKMTELFRKGMTEYYTELPDIPLVQWFHRIPVNTWYWSNWPDEKNPYMNSALWHLTVLQVILGLKATDKA